MKLSVIIPAHNEETSISQTVESLIRVLKANAIEYEIVIVNDNSSDGTGKVLEDLALRFDGIKAVANLGPKGFGWAIRRGLDCFSGEAVVIYMGDGSDDPEDVVQYYRKIQEGCDCVFGSRFIRGAKVSGYPKLKLILNRLGNKFIQLLFFIKYNDVSNAFKAYKKEVIYAIQPLVSQYFNITVEMPLKAIIRGFSYCVIPISWNGRKSGVSKYNIKELSRKYFFSILYVWLEKILLKQDLKK
jgi:dolichol-phosphate mannosyltransferase